MFTRSCESVLLGYVPPKNESEFAATDGAGGDGGAGDDYVSNIGIDTDGCCDYVTPKEEPESKFIDFYYQPLKEPEPELGDSDGDAVNVNCYYECDPPEEGPEQVAPGDDTDADSGPGVGYDCSHCGISLSTEKFKVEHELRCVVRMQQKELESQVAKLYLCGYCRCPFVNEEELGEHQQQRYCRKKTVATRKDSNGPYYGCDKCEYVAKKKGNLEKHLLTHDKSNAEWFTCKHCFYKTVCKNAMTEHAKVHDNSFRCCCPICGKSFRRKPCLQDHLLRQHFDELSDKVSKLITYKIYTCNICNQFRTIAKADFNKHVAITHLKGKGRQKYRCPHCSYFTFYKNHLKVHSKTHEEQKDIGAPSARSSFHENED